MGVYRSFKSCGGALQIVFFSLRFQFFLSSFYCSLTIRHAEGKLKDTVDELVGVP
jgi:hypothetical protein